MCVQVYLNVFWKIVETTRGFINADYVAKKYISPTELNSVRHEICWSGTNTIMAVKNTRNMDFIIGGNIIGTDHQTKTRISRTVVNGKKNCKEKKRKLRGYFFSDKISGF